MTLAATGRLNNIIGGTTGVNPNNSCTGACNLISGNTSTGIGITGEKAAVKGNYIGANVSGTAPQ